MNTIDPMQHTGLVHMVLNTHTWLYSQSSCWTYDDAYQEGMLAFIEALQTYDSDQGTVGTYCLPRIKWGLYRAHREQQGLIKKPGHLHELQAKYKKIQLEYIRSKNSEPDVKYMAKRMKMTVPELQRFLDLFSPVRSLDAPLSEDDDLTLADTVKDERDQFNTVETHLHMAKLRKDLQRMMDERLTAPDQKLLKEYYAWDGGKQPTIKALADKNHFSVEVTRGKIQRALTGFNKFRPELVRHYPDIIMSQIYKQIASSMGELRRLGGEMLLIYLKIGDLIQVNDKYGAVMAVLNSDSCFEFRTCGHTTRISVKNVYDFEMMDNKITRVYTVQKKRDPDSASGGGPPLQ